MKSSPIENFRSLLKVELLVLKFLFCLYIPYGIDYIALQIVPSA